MHCVNLAAGSLDSCPKFILSRIVWRRGPTTALIGRRLDGDGPRLSASTAARAKHDVRAARAKSFVGRTMFWPRGPRAPSDGCCFGSEGPRLSSFGTSWTRGLMPSSFEQCWSRPRRPSLQWYRNRRAHGARRTRARLHPGRRDNELIREY